MDTPHILAAGRNCWKVDQAEKISLLVDGAAYFAAFREAVRLAEKDIYICGWDINSRIDLLPDDPEDGLPVKLGDFLNALAASRSGLHIHILIWDFIRFTDMELQWFHQYRLSWLTRTNIHFRLDSYHPVGACQHHKFVVIDDTLTFAGGVDLTRYRWDTPEHIPGDPRRRTDNGILYRPHHDTQMMVSGPTALSMGDYFRERWKMAGGRTLKRSMGRESGDRWPEKVPVDLQNCRVGIARTTPRYRKSREVREVERLYLDSFGAARKYILMENQYLTSPILTAALQGVLQKRNGPEVIIIMPLATDGWLSQYTMDILRTRAVQKLREADRYGRLGVYYAFQEGLGIDDSIKIHSKLMMADDRLVRIGSANLNNRSMGFDTEVDFAVEVDEDSDQVRGMKEFRDRLLGEHLGVAAAEVGEAVGQAGSLLKAIEKLQGSSRTLKTLEILQSDLVDIIAEEQGLFDPERPIEPEKFIKEWQPVEKLSKGRVRTIQLMVLLIFLLGAALAWRFTPLRELISEQGVAEMVSLLKKDPLAWLYVLTAYAAGSLLMIPITVLIVLTVLVFGLFQGFFMAMTGALISGSITYWLGRMMGRETVRTLAGEKVNTLSRKMGKSGIFATFVIRLMPVAPYSLVNIMAGASHIRFRDFLLGTLLGMLPGTVAIALIIDRGSALISDPGPFNILSAVGAAGAIVFGAFFIRRKLQEK